MYPALWWGITAVICFTLEIFTASFFFLWIGAGALLTALLSFFVPEAWVQYTVFAVSSVLLVAVSRRWAGRFSGPTRRLANVDALVGRTAVVVRLLDDHTGQFYVNVDGELWRAETPDHRAPAVDQKVTIREVRGNFLIVGILA